MHSEYGWMGQDTDRNVSVKGLKQLFPASVSTFTLDEESSRRRGSSADEVVRISYGDIDPGIETRRVNGGLGWREHQVDALLIQQVQVPFQISGVLGQVFLGCELAGIDEDGYRDRGIVGAGLPDQRQMALVQRSHSGNQTQGALDRGAGSAHGFYAVDDLH